MQLLLRLAEMPPLPDLADIPDDDEHDLLATALLGAAFLNAMRLGGLQRLLERQTAPADYAPFLAGSTVDARVRGAAHMLEALRAESPAALVRAFADTADERVYGLETYRAASVLDSLSQALGRVALGAIAVVAGVPLSLLVTHVGLIAVHPSAGGRLPPPFVHASHGVSAPLRPHLLEAPVLLLLPGRVRCRQ